MRRRTSASGLRTPIRTSFVPPRRKRANRPTVSPRFGARCSAALRSRHRKWRWAPATCSPGGPAKTARWSIYQIRPSPPARSRSSRPARRLQPGAIHPRPSRAIPSVLAARPLARRLARYGRQALAAAEKETSVDGLGLGWRPHPGVLVCRAASVDAAGTEAGARAFPSHVTWQLELYHVETTLPGGRRGGAAELDSSRSGLLHRAGEGDQEVQGRRCPADRDHLGAGGTVSLQNA